MAQIQACPDQLQPDWIINDAGIYTLTEQWGARRREMSSRTEFQSPPAPVFIIDHETANRIHKSATGIRQQELTYPGRLAGSSFSAQ